MATDAYDPEYRKKVYTAMSIELIRRLAVQLVPLHDVHIVPSAPSAPDLSTTNEQPSLILPATTGGLTVSDYSIVLQTNRDETHNTNIDATVIASVWSTYITSEYRKIGLGTLSTYTRQDRIAAVFFTKNLATFLAPTRTRIDEFITPETHSRSEAISIASKRYRTISARPLPMLAYCPFLRTDAALLEYTNTSILEIIVVYKSPIRLQLLSTESVAIMPPNDPTIIPTITLFPFDGFDHLIHTPEWRALESEKFGIAHVELALRYRIARIFDMDNQQIEIVIQAWRKTRVCLSPFLREWIGAGLTAEIIHAIGLAPHPVIFSLLDADAETIISGLRITPQWLENVYPAQSIDIFAMFRPGSCRAMLFPDAQTTHAFKNAFTTTLQHRTYKKFSSFEQSTLFTKK